MKLWSTALWLLQKDLRLWLRDRTGMMLGLLLPIALVTVFGMVMKFAFGGGSGMPKVELWVVDEDDSEASRKFIVALREVSMLAVQPKVGDAPITARKAREQVVDGEAHHALIVQKGHGAALAAGKEPLLTIVRDPGRSMEAKLVGIGLMQATMAAADGSSMPWSQNTDFALRAWDRNPSEEFASIVPEGGLFHGRRDEERVRSRT